MNKPAETGIGWNTDIKESYEYYFDITDGKRPIFTPVMFANQNESCFLRYKQNFSNRYHNTSKSVIKNFQSGYSHLERFKIRNIWYLVARGTIFRMEIGEDTIEKLYPLIIFCFDENTNWDTKTGYKIVINNKEWSNPDNKTIRPKLSKIVDIYEKDSDIIYTNDIIKYCFNTPEKLKFKSIKEQSEFLSSLAKQTVELELQEVEE